MGYIIFKPSGEVVNPTEEVSTKEDTRDPDPHKEEEITPRIRVPHR
jgi:hypothetical protein